jgi:hypothetical protein
MKWPAVLLGVILLLGAGFPTVGVAASSDELTVPSLVEWLVNDDMPIPSTRVRFAAPGANGSGETARAPGELQAMLSASEPGDIVVAAGGHYHVPNGLAFPSGATGHPVTLMAAPGEAAVIDAGSDFATFQHSGTGAWTQAGLSSSDIANKVWRSTATFGDPDARLVGYWIEFEHVHQILSVPGMTELKAPYGAEPSFENYAGPAAYLAADGRVYIRMQKPHPDKYCVGRKWQSNLWPGHPEAIKDGCVNYPVTENPNDYEIRLFRMRTNYAFDPGMNGGFINVGSGINSQGFRFTLRGHDIEMRRGTHLVWQAFVAASQPSAPTLIGPLQDLPLGQVYNVTVDRGRFSDGSKRHVSVSEWKFGGPLEPVRGAFLEHVESRNPDKSNYDYGRGTWNMTFRDCTIADFHELMVGGDHTYRFKNCAIFNILNDGIQANPYVSRVEIGYSFLLNSAFGGNGARGNDPNPGEWYFHHNVIDARTQVVSVWGRESFPPFVWLNHSADGSQPRKYYNNTLLWAPDVLDLASCGFNHNSNYDSSSDVPHEVFNNIVIRQDTQRYNNFYHSGSRHGPSDFVCRGLHYGGSNEQWDYNLYWRSLPGPLADGLIQAMAKRKAPQENYDTLAAWRASRGYKQSRDRYGPGFEANGSEQKPEMPSVDDFPSQRFDYRPTATAAITTAKDVSLSGTDWWSGAGPSWGAQHFSWSGLAPSPWKGALDPNGAAMPVGVQNP